MIDFVQYPAYPDILTLNYHAMYMTFARLTSYGLFLDYYLIVLEVKLFVFALMSPPPPPIEVFQGVISRFFSGKFLQCVAHVMPRQLQVIVYRFFQKPGD